MPTASGPVIERAEYERLRAEAGYVLEKEDSTPQQVADTLVSVATKAAASVYSSSEALSAPLRENRGALLFCYGVIVGVLVTTIARLLP